jgi:hypothetical protein
VIEARDLKTFLPCYSSVSLTNCDFKCDKIFAKSKEITQRKKKKKKKNCLVAE